jgi:transcriptional regulator with GAF, ATPase, and Fis domain/CHASE2 domain-containing sensor protein
MDRVLITFIFMKGRLSRIHPRFPGVIAVLLAGAVLAILQSRSDFPGNMDADALLRLRGTRPLSPQILLIAIDESDVKALGGWPVTRDYYGYLIHILAEKRARVIGLDVLLDTPSRQYPEYDRLLADFILTSRRVVLTDVVDASNPSNPSLQVNPLPEFARAAAATGFGNLGGESVIRSVPLVMGEGGNLRPSFGLAMAQTWLGAAIRRDKRQIVLSFPKQKNGRTTPGRDEIRVPVDGRGRMRLNPAGCMASIRFMRLTEFLKRYESAPDSMDFDGRLVLTAATAPSLPVIVSTPLCPQVPASVIQATVAENILRRNWLNAPPFILSLMWILAWSVPAFPVSRIPGLRRRVPAAAAVVAAAILLPLICIAAVRVVMPVHASILMFLGTASAVRWRMNRERISGHTALKNAIQAQLSLKESALAEAEQRLVETQALLAEEAGQKRRLSESSRRLAEEKEEAVLELEKQIRDLRDSFEPAGETRPLRFQEILHGPDSPVVPVLRLAEMAARDDIPVLIQGETGTGKELVAAAIHRASPRHQKPFVAVNCGALSESLLESELFGHERGAFTGAHQLRRGRFELAEGGTLFLDEITETTPAFQARLLRVLQEGAFERVGGERTLRADVRIIAAHNKNLRTEVQEKRFREDLYFRLKGFPITLPPLRNRAGDIPVLARFFVRKYGGAAPARVSDSVMEKFRVYRWPGNVRELENTVRRAVLLAGSDGRDMIRIKDLPEEIRSGSDGTQPAPYHPLEAQILETLRAFRFSHAAIGQTARALGNRDRGTVTEYFRGLCFQFLVQSGGDIRKAASAMAANDDPQAAARIEAKMRDYLENVRSSVSGMRDARGSGFSCFKGLPRKFHPFLQRLIETIE